MFVWCININWYCLIYAKVKHWTFIIRFTCKVNVWCFFYEEFNLIKKVFSMLGLLALILRQRKYYNHLATRVNSNFIGYTEILYNSLLKSRQTTFLSWLCCLNIVWYHNIRRMKIFFSKKFSSKNCDKLIVLFWKSLENLWLETYH